MGLKVKNNWKMHTMAGADLVVIGTAFEEDESFFDELKSPLSGGHFPQRGNNKIKDK